jgi:hypothetical protein
MLLLTTVLLAHLVVGLSAWWLTGDRRPLYLGLTALPLWVWAYALF